MEAAAFVAIALTVITAATPVVFAALGELIVEKSGVLNLGVEGMMLIGAIGGFAIATSFDSAVGGFLASVAAGIALSLVFAFITQTLRANQVATGLALTLFGTGLAALLGQDFVGQPFPESRNWRSRCSRTFRSSAHYCSHMIWSSTSQSSWFSAFGGSYSTLGLA